MFFNVLGQHNKFLVVDVKKGRNSHYLSYSSIVVTIVEELIQSVTTFLRLSYEKVMVFHGLRAAASKFFQSDISDIFDKFVVDDEVINIHNEHVQHFLAFWVISTHFIESRLRP